MRKTKLSALSLTGLIFGLVLAAAVTAQDKTIILIRHVEKDSSPTADKTDPEVSEAGRARALALVQKMSKYKPDAIYSTNYKRTRDSVKPLSEKRKKPVQIYDPANQQKLVDEMMASKIKKFLVVGHANTIPALANLIAKKEIFKTLSEAEFGVIWVIRIKDGKVDRMEILGY